MMMFDASNRDECQVVRYRTNTPLQALIMLNDPTMIEASKALADKILQKESDPTKIITEAFKTIICRSPSSSEMEALLSYWKDAKIDLEKNTSRSDKMMSIGVYQPKSKNKTELATTMHTIQIIYNMQEAITKT
jgi:Protein of unknown function (DUF1553)